MAGETGTTAPLDRLRNDPLAHWIAMLFALGVGLALTTVHWVGLVAAGGLVGVVATTFKRALLAGFGVGVLVLVAWFIMHAVTGTLGNLLATGEFLLIAVVIGVLGPMLGSVVRGLV